MGKSLDELRPEFREDIEKVIAELTDWCRVHLPGRKPVVLETFRTQARQDWLYAQGRTRKGRIVTWTTRSKHTERIACDIGFSVLGTMGYWDAPEAAWQYYGHLCRKHGLVWGGDWESPDRPHCQKGD